ncbi:hypothetical protein NW762_012457 [Fusarium torreyae]|uniref:Carrier domain-containing protein n=1 Tax=Fusarium torreyae TaxID=1237075 RepID=A0A9W8RRR3_9HYPO|nr:hypothetical protein NW762_012457 [Fusarium torreyae]
MSAQAAQIPPIGLPLLNKEVTSTARTMFLPSHCRISITKIQASFAIVLGKYSSSNEIQLGIAKIAECSSNDHKQHEPITQIDVYPVKVEINQSDSLSELLRKVHEQVEEAKISTVNDSNPKYMAATDSHLNAVIIQRGNAGELEVAHNTEPKQRRHVQHSSIPAKFSELCIEFFLKETERQLLVRCSSATGAFNGTFEGLLDVWQHILEQICEDDCKSLVSQLNYIPPCHMRTLLDWNSKVPKPVERTIHEIIQARTMSQPGAPAICSWDGNFTYGQLDTLCTDLAHHLVGLSIGIEDFVAFCFDKSVWPTVCMLAILKAGGAFVALDPKHPAKRSKRMLEAAGVSTVLTSPRYAHIFSEMNVKVVQVDEDSVQALPSQACTTSLPSAKTTNAMYIVNTSGSTGYPKSIVVEHSGFVSRLPGLAEMGNITPDSRVLQFSAYSFDVYIHETFTTLAYGGCICVPNEDERVNNLEVPMVRMDVNTANLTPSIARLLRPQDVPCLRVLSIGGETISRGLLESWADRVELGNFYGPAECIISCTGKKSLRADDQLNNIGTPLQATLWVVDHDNHDVLCPVGCIGELLVGGPGLARGYTDDDLTSASFITNPQWAANLPRTRQYTRFYKSGDLVKYNSDGSLVYIGRKDSQVKVRGQRLELGEVEHHLSTCDSVREAVVQLPSEGIYKSQLVAVVVLKDIKKSSENIGPLTLVTGPDKVVATAQIQDICSILSTTLAPYMVPQTWLAVNSIPTNASGKLDRLRVKQLLIEQTVLVNYTVIHDQHESHSPPLTDTEKTLQRLWADVLNMSIESIHANSHFLELGGNSLKGMRLISLARRKKIRITLAGIFEKPVLAAMASSVNSTKNRSKKKRAVDPPENDVIPVRRPFELVRGEVVAREMFKAEAHLLQDDISWDDVQDMYPCTPSQAGLIALSAKYPGSYTLQVVYELPQSIDIRRFKAAWQTCYRGIDILRALIIPSTDFGPCQTILNPDDSRKSTIWQQQGGDVSLNNYLESDLQRVISYGSLLNRFTFLQDDKYFVWTCHHSSYDGVSIGLILRAVERAYHHGQSQTTVIEEETLSMASFISHINATDPQASQAFWQSYLSGATPAKFPRALSVTSEPRADSRFQIQVPLTVHGSKSDILSSTIIRAAWALVLGRHSDSSDIVFGVTLGGRTADVAGIDRIVGPTLTTLPVRVRIDPQETARAYLKRVQAEATAMLAFEHVGIPMIAAMGPEFRALCDLSSLLLVQPPGSDLGLHLLDMPPVEFTQGKAGEVARPEANSYALSIEIELGDEVLGMTVRYDSKLIPGPQMERIADQLAHAIQQLAAAAVVGARKRSVGDIDLANEQDISQIAVWNKSIALERNTTITAEVARWVAYDATAPAVCAWDAELSYGELDRVAGRMARILTGMGVGVGHVVPICFDKSAWAVVAVLGILRAGSAYVALDPAHPRHRLEGIISDVDASVIVAAPQHASIFSTIQGVHVLACNESLIANLVAAENQAETHMDIDSSFTPPNPSSPAFILFSSGSTGRPKGIIVEHQAVCTSTNAFGTAWGVGPGTRVFQFAAFIFDVSVADMVMSLTRGACVCMPSDHERLHDTANAIRRLRANYVSLTPSVAALLSPADVPGLNTLVLGGEAPTRENIRTWAPYLNLVICYGPAECAITCSGTEPATLHSDPSNIGYALGCRMWIVDPTDHNQLAPIGCVGEILVEGPILALGYLKDPVKTAAVFIEDPAFVKRFSNDTQPRRFYKTGDLGYYRPQLDGSISFAGRKDTQVKVRGQRVELGEIEHHVYAMTDVQHVVTTVPSAGPLKDRLTAVLVMADTVISHSDAQDRGVLAIQSGLSNQKTASLASGITDYLTDRLPRYMIPSTFIFVANIPFNTSGKLDRKKVQAWVEAMDETTYQLVARATELESPDSPLQPTEELLLHVCSKVLKLDPAKIRLGQSFLALGGDSITAMLVVSRCRSEGMAVSVKNILRSKTLHHLASLITPMKASPTSLAPKQTHFGQGNDLPITTPQADYDAKLWSSARDYLEHVDVAEIEAVYPCTPVQTGMLMAHARNPRFYEVKNIFEVKSTIPGVPVDVDLLEQAWKDLVDRQPVLRTVFLEISSNNVFHQAIIKGRNDTRVLRFDIAEDNDDNGIVQDFFSRQTIDYKAHRPANQFSIAVTASGRVLIKIDMFHALCDGTTWNLIFRELSQAYGNKGYVDQSPPPSYSDYITYLATQPTQVALEYWQKYLAGVQPCMFPTIQRNDIELSPSTTHTVIVNFDRGTELQSLCAKHGITISNFVQTVWSIVLRSFVGFDEVCFGYVVSGRDVPLANIEQAIGTYIGQLPCRISIQDTDSVKGVAKRLQDDFFNGLVHQHISIAELYHSLPGVSGQLFNTNVHCMRTPNIEPHDSSRLQFEYKHSVDPSEYDITLHAMVSDNHVGFHLGYWDTALSEDKAEQLAGLINSTLNSIMEDIERHVGSLNGILGKVEPVSSTSSSNTSAGPINRDNGFNVTDEGVQRVEGTEGDTPRNRSLLGQEEALRQVCVDILGINPDIITHSTRLRSLGVDSYLAIQIVRRVQDFGLELKFADALSGMTLERMAARLTPTTIARSAVPESSSPSGPPDSVTITTALPPFIKIATSPSASTENHTSSASDDSRVRVPSLDSSDSSDSKTKETVPTPALINNTPSRILFKPEPNSLPLVTVDLEQGRSSRSPKPTDKPRETSTVPSDSLELGWGSIESLVPTTNVQQAMLRSQQRLSTANLYMPRAIWRVKGLADSVGIRTLEEGWQRVVGMHSCLRTVFVRIDASDGCRYYQLVLKNISPCLKFIEADSEIDALKLLVDRPPDASDFPHQQELTPAHILTICHITGTGHLMFSLSISHALSDAVSSAIILQQMSAICGSASSQDEDPMLLPSSPPFSDIQRYYDLREVASRDKAVEFWDTYLSGVEPCHFPCGVNSSSSSLGELDKVSVDFKRTSELRNYTMATGITVSTVFRTAWALLLAKWLARTDVCFGYVISGREASVARIEDIVGPVLNILPCRVNAIGKINDIWQQHIPFKTEMEEARGLEPLLDKVQDDLLESLPHQFASPTLLANATHHESSMFNTLVNFRNNGLSGIFKVEGTKLTDSQPANRTQSIKNNVVGFEVLWYEDPMDFDIVLAVGDMEDDLEIDLNYWDGRLSRETVDLVAEEFLHILHTILDTCGSVRA